MVHQIVNYKYKAFVETLILTLLILLIGFFAGYFAESYRVNKVIENYKEFEIDVTDLRLQNYYFQIMNSASCEKAIKQNFIFADNIYQQGLMIEKYEQANELSEDILREKKKNILLKTELWLNSILLKEKCDIPFHTIVYVYSQEGNDIKKAEQDAISNTLRRLKEERGNEVILLPIAGNMGLDIVYMQLQVYDVTYLPSIIIDEKYVLEGFHEIEEIKGYLDRTQIQANVKSLYLN